MILEAMLNDGGHKGHRGLQIGTVALTLFALNQILEALIINFSGYSYSALCQWDCTWYAAIVANGYDIVPRYHPGGDKANWAFFPAHPIASVIIRWLTGLSPEISVIITGRIFFALSIFAFLRLGKKYYPSANPWLVGSLVAFSPYSIYGNVGYAEPLFLFSTCCFFIALLDRKYISAGVAGGVLTSVRFVGLASILSYLATSMRDFLVSDSLQRRRILLGIMFIPLGLSIFSVYLYLLSGDALAFAHIQRGWNRVASNPFGWIPWGLRGDLTNKYWALLSIMALGTSVYFVLVRRPELAVFGFVATLVPLATGLWAMPRYIWWQAPFLLFCARFMQCRRNAMVAAPIFVAGFVFMYISWLSGKAFVV